MLSRILGLFSSSSQTNQKKRLSCFDHVVWMDKCPSRYSTHKSRELDHVEDKERNGLTTSKLEAGRLDWHRNWRFVIVKLGCQRASTTSSSLMHLSKVKPSQVYVCKTHTVTTNRGVLKTSVSLGQWWTNVNQSINLYLNQAKANKKDRDN